MYRIHNFESTGTVSCLKNIIFFITDIEENIVGFPIAVAVLIEDVFVICAIHANRNNRIVCTECA